MSKYPAHYDSYLRAHFQGIGAATAGSGIGVNNPQTIFGLPMDPSVTSAPPDGYVIKYSATQGYWTVGVAGASFANPTATASDVAVNGVATTAMRSDAAPAVQKATTSQFGLVKPDGTTITISTGIITVPTATSSVLGVVKPDGTTVTISGGVLSTPGGANPTATASDTAVNGSAATFMRSDGSPAIQKTSSSVFGLCKVDNSTITAASGVITAVGFAPSGAVFHPGYRSGRYYGSIGITSFTATSALTTGTLYAVPIFVGATTTFTKLAVWVTGGVASSHVELGVYSNLNGAPNALLLDAGQVSTTTGSSLAAITGLSLQLTPGWYWLAMSPSANSIGIRGFGATSQVLLWASGTTDLNADLGGNFSVAWPYSTGNLPNPFGAVTQANAVAPYIVIGL